jgi:hypothetical protein
MALSDQPRASPSKQIMHLMYYFLLQRVTVDDLLQDKSSLYKSNCFRWCDQMIKSPEMQRFYVKFRNELEEVAEAEMQRNRKRFAAEAKEVRPPQRVEFERESP